MGTLRGTKNAQGTTDETCQLCRKGVSGDTTKWFAGTAPHRVLHFFLPNIDSHVAVDVIYAIGDQPGARRLSRECRLQRRQQRRTEEIEFACLVFCTSTSPSSRRKIKRTYRAIAECPTSTRQCLLLRGHFHPRFDFVRIMALAENTPCCGCKHRVQLLIHGAWPQNHAALSTTHFAPKPGPARAVEVGGNAASPFIRFWSR